jgi:hypothetical protein
MTFKPQNIAGQLRHDFSGEAANDEELPIHSQLLAHMDAQQEDILRSFREELTGVFREMNMDVALTKQSGMLNGEPLGNETPVIDNTQLAVWMYVDMETWNMVIDSYIVDLAQNDPEKFAALYEAAGPACVKHYQDTNTHLDTSVVRLAFEDSYKDEMKALALVADTLRRNLPGVTTITAIAHIGDSHITPIVNVKAPADKDLRDIVSAYINRQTSVLRPIPN